MSRSLAYAVVKPVKEHSLPKEPGLMDAIEKMWGMPCVLDETCIASLRAFKCAGIESAQDVIDAIQNHGAIEVFLRY